MHIKHIHETIEKLSQYACEEACKNKDTIDTKELGEVVDMVKDLTEAEYYARIAKAMEQADEEEKEEIKHLMKKMKEEGKDWDEEEAKRYYRGQSRNSSGRYTSNRGRRGYEEPMYYDMMFEIHNPMEWNRDMDRMNGRMYYSNNSMGQGNSNNSKYGYSYDNYMENRRNYSKTEPEQKQYRMKMMEDYTKDLMESINKVMEDVSPEEKTMLRSKLTKVINNMQ